MSAQAIRSRVSRRTLGALIMAFALIAGLGTAAVFAGLTIANDQRVAPAPTLFKLDTRDYQTAWGKTTHEHVAEAGLDTGVFSYDRNATPANELVPAPHSTNPTSDEEDGGVFSSFALTDGQVARLRGSLLRTTSKAAPKTTTTDKSATSCDPRDASCLRALACKGIPNSFIPSTPCTPGDLICQARRSCG